VKEPDPNILKFPTPEGKRNREDDWRMRDLDHPALSAGCVQCALKDAGGPVCARAPADRRFTSRYSTGDCIVKGLPRIVMGGARRAHRCRPVPDGELPKYRRTLPTAEPAPAGGVVKARASTALAHGAVLRPPEIHLKDGRNRDTAQHRDNIDALNEVAGS